MTLNGESRDKTKEIPSSGLLVRTILPESPAPTMLDVYPDPEDIFWTDYNLMLVAEKREEQREDFRRRNAVEKPVEVCLAVLGNREFGNRHMVFDRLAWWLIKKGATEMTSLENDPAWDELLVIGFDADGKPLEFPLESEDEILTTVRDAGSKPLPLAKAETSVAEALSSGLVGEPMNFTSRREKALVNLLSYMYNDRRTAWQEPQ